MQVTKVIVDLVTYYKDVYNFYKIIYVTRNKLKSKESARCEWFLLSICFTESGNKRKFAKRLSKVFISSTRLMFSR